MNESRESKVPVIRPEDATFCCDESLACQRIDKVLADRFPDFSRAVFQTALDAGAVLLDGHKVKPSWRICSGARITIDTTWFEPAALVPQKAEFQILFEDDSILVINKPAGMVVHPAPGNQEGTLVNALLFYDFEHFGQLDDSQRRPGIVHRLDQDTSGVMVVAKTEDVYKTLKEAFREHEVSKIYYTIVEGILPHQTDTLVTQMGKLPGKWDRRGVVAEGGKEAVTKYRVLASNNGKSLVKVKILTGRTHQIRIHMSYLGCPVAGDIRYGGHIPPARQMLHSAVLMMNHPVTGEKMRIVAPLPQDFLSELEAIGISCPVIDQKP